MTLTEKPFGMTCLTQKSLMFPLLTDFLVREYLPRKLRLATITTGIMIFSVVINKDIYTFKTKPFKIIITTNTAMQYLTLERTNVLIAPNEIFTYLSRDMKSEGNMFLSKKDMLREKDDKWQWQWRKAKTLTDYRKVEWGTVVVTIKENYWGNKVCQFYSLAQVIFLLKC